MQGKLPLYIRIATSSFIILSLLFFLQYIYGGTYEELVTKVCNSTYRFEYADKYKADTSLKLLYNSLRFFLPLLLISYAIASYFSIKRKSYSNWIYVFSDSIKENISFIKNLPLYNRLTLFSVLLILFVFLLWGIHKLPLHYDEGYSYMYFSGKGILSSLTFYPLPNNHVLHNILSAVFLKLPLNKIAAMRLDNLFAALLSAYYFFKLAGKYLTINIALLSTVIFSFSYSFLYYNTQSRGYGILLFFSLFAFYCIICLVEGANLKKYLTFYILSCIAGFFSIPSFLYPFLVLNLLLLIHLFYRYKVRGIGIIIISSLIIISGVLVLYTPLLIRNGWKALSNVDEKSYEELKNLVLPHLRETLGYFTGEYSIGLILVFVLILVSLLRLFEKSYKVRFISISIMIFLLSPIPIMFAHKTIPFYRTWIYLLVPLTLVLANVLYLPGMFINKISALKSAARPVSLLLSIALSILMISGFMERNKRQVEIDYVAQDYRTLLREKLPDISGYCVSGGLGFYLAEDLSFEKNILYNQGLGSASIDELDTLNCDMVVFDKNYFSDTINLGNYAPVEYDNKYFLVYLRRGL